MSPAWELKLPDALITVEMKRGETTGATEGLASQRQHM